MTPRPSVENECRKRGQLVVSGCLDLLSGEEVDPRLIYALAARPRNGR